MLCLVKLIRRVEPCGIEYRAPDGWDGSGICQLKPPGGAPGEAFAWIPNAADKANIKVLAADFAEPLSGAAKMAIENIGDKSIALVGGGLTVAETIKELLTVHARTDGSRWLPFQCGRDGIYRLWVAGREIATWQGMDRPASVQYNETWPATGTSWAGQTMAWATVSGAATPRFTAGTPNYFSPDAATTNATGYTTTVADSNDNFTIATCDVSGNSGTLVAVGARASTANNHFRYDAFLRRNTLASRLREVASDGTATTLAEDAVTDPGATGVSVKCQGDGGNVRAWVGAWDSGNIADASHTGPSCKIRADAPTAATEAKIYSLTFQDVAFSGAAAYLPPDTAHRPTHQTMVAM